MPSQDQLKEIFNLYDEELDGKIDGTQIGDVVRAAGLKPTNAMVVKASGQEFKRKGEKRITFEEWLPIFEQLSKEKHLLNLNDILAYSSKASPYAHLSPASLIAANRLHGK
ncbi:hypothetical protein TELCIR_14332 [Teladorsagia circumcincta]|uniref:EF-hand domain-containing protein n=1 Tax=Teladorsagia circumcincta TaxID=45464 RepID=A0A2G9U3G7_TELCI|nr:hypothetical protein TELCIR_14332 [Teladorsagia circumcincta]